MLKRDFSPRPLPLSEVMRMVGAGDTPLGSPGVRIPENMRRGLAGMDALAALPIWRDQRLLRGLADSPLAFVLGLDVHGCADRLRCVTIRAYTEASVLETAFRTFLQDLQEASVIAGKLRSFQRKQWRIKDGWIRDPDDLIRQGLPILERHRIDNADAVRARRRWASRPAKSLDEFIEELEGLGRLRNINGRREQRGCEFLLLRLAEVFALLSDKCQVSYRTHFARGEEPENHWHQFLAASLGMLGWGTFDWVDGGLRKVFWAGGYPGVRSEDEETRRTIIGRRRRSAVTSLAKMNTGLDGRIPYGSLQSVGMLIDFRLHPLEIQRRFNEISEGHKLTHVCKTGLIVSV